MSEMTPAAVLATTLRLGIGYAIRSGRLPENAPSAINGFIIHISLPALILLYVHRLPIDSSLLYPIAAPWILFSAGLLLFIATAKAARWSAQTTGGLILSGSLATHLWDGPPLLGRIRLGCAC